MIDLLLLSLLSEDLLDCPDLLLLFELEEPVVEDLSHRHDLVACVVEFRQVIVLLDDALEVLTILEVSPDFTAGNLRLPFIDDAGPLAELVDDRVITELNIEELRLPVVAEVLWLLAIHPPNVQLGEVVQPPFLFNLLWAQVSLLHVLSNA